ncbi:MAG: aminotransferase class I/II-fold pyridoxal phosphate-dependent enzyme [Deltaproteobacteria bacterium]|nr:aminotransferase class I/II-fold pyridoxal phosphate-dependent enzyme [Deltaproteobacteria bacterium]
MAKRPEAPGPSTQAVHAGQRKGQRARSQSHALTPPIHQTSTFWFRDSAELREYAEGRLDRDEYGRYSNPSWRVVQDKLSELEGAEETVLFSSGMSAATSTFLALIPQGGHIVVTNDCYRRTRQFIQQYLSKLDVTATVIAPADTTALKDALQDDTVFFFTESPTNPYLRVIDLPEAARVCHERGVKVIIDATFATPINHRPLEQGADLVIHSATKYLGGHNDLIAGTVSGSAEEIAPVREACGVLGGILDPHAAYLLLRGMKTLSLRMERHNANGLAVARWLEGQPKVRKVWYPGLESHPDHEVASRLMQGFAGVVTFEIDGDLEDTIRFTDACRLPYIAPSLGGVETLVEMPVLMSYWDYPAEERQAYGITDSLIRLACGIEDVDDLIADLAQAL